MHSFGGAVCASISVFGGTVSLLTAIKTITEWIFFLVPDVNNLLFCKGLTLSSVEEVGGGENEPGPAESLRKRGIPLFFIQN